MTKYTELITAADLQAVLENPDETRRPGTSVKILDCRAALGDPDHGRRAFAEGHLPDAVYLSLDDDLASPPGAGGRHPLPEPGELASRLGGLGISDADQIVVYDDAGGAFAARAWWCIRWLGHEAVAVLDGGMKAWPGALSRAPAPIQPATFSLRPSLTRTISAAELQACLGSRALIDARSQARFAGEEEPIDPVAGHIPGAVCLPFQGNLKASGRFLAPAELRDRFAPQQPDAETICYCGSGVTAAHNILALKVAGFAEPVLYPGSWSEWLQSPDRPIDTGA